MSLPLPKRLRETALRIQREESIHLGNLRRLLVEAADALDERDPPTKVRTWPVPAGPSAGGVARAAKLSPGRRQEIARAAAQARWNR